MRLINRLVLSAWWSHKCHNRQFPWKTKFLPLYPFVVIIFVLQFCLASKHVETAWIYVYGEWLKVPSYVIDSICSILEFQINEGYGGYGYLSRETFLREEMWAKTFFRNKKLAIFRGKIGRRLFHDSNLGANTFPKTRPLYHKVIRGLAEIFGNKV